MIQAIQNCHLCALANTRTNTVPGQGNSNAVVLFVGEGPGHDEDLQGLPFVGRSGKYLTQVMESVGIQRQDVYITNVVKCRPPNNRDPLQQELKACSDYLDAQIQLINPRIIVTLGRFSMRRWFPNGSITRIHGQIRNIGHGRIALAMFHPAAALRNPKWQGEFVKDMGKLPLLIERAQKADALAERGEGIPAGAPHPGDMDYIEPEPTSSLDRTAADSGKSMPPEDEPDDESDDAEQLSLL